MKRYIISSFLMLFYFANWAQPHPGFSKLYHYEGDTLQRPDGISAMTYDTATGNIFFALTIGSNLSPRGFTEFYKVDINGDIIQKGTDSVENFTTVHYCVISSNDNQYLYWGGISYEMKDSVSSQWRLCKTDKDLNIIWQRDYVLNARGGQITAIKTIAASEDIMLLGSRYTGPDNAAGFPVLPNRIQLKRIDSSGNIVSEYTPGPDYYNTGIDMAVTEDGNYMVTGRTFSWGQNNGSAYNLKVDENGDEEWHNLYAQNSYTCWLLKIIKIKEEGHYINVGQVVPNSNYDGRAYINKVDGYGTAIWEKWLGINNIADQFWSVCNAVNYDCVTSGSVYFPDKQEAHGWMVRFDKDGNEKWNRLLTAQPRQGDHEYLYNVAALSDGSFIAAGSTFGQDVYGRWSQEGWLVRVDSNGCMTPDCLNGGVGIQDKQKSKAALSIYPNPAKSRITLQREIIFPAHTVVTLLDHLGRRLKELPAPSGKQKQEYNLEGLPSQVYYLQIKAGAEIYVEKVTLAP